MCQTTTPQDAASVQFLLDSTYLTKGMWIPKSDLVLQRKSVSVRVRRSTLTSNLIFHLRPRQLCKNSIVIVLVCTSCGSHVVVSFTHHATALRRSQSAFLALQIAGGHIGLVVVLAFAVFSRRVRRDPTYMNFCITWIFSSVVFSIL